MNGFIHLFYTHTQTHKWTHTHTSSRRRRGLFASLCTAVLFLWFPPKHYQVFLFFLLRTMHVIKVQWISFRDEKSKKEKKKGRKKNRATRTRTTTEHKNWRSGWDCDRKAGPKVLTQRGCRWRRRQRWYGDGLILFFFCFFLIDFPSSLWGRVSFQPRSGGGAGEKVLILGHCWEIKSGLIFFFFPLLPQNLY